MVITIKMNVTFVAELFVAIECYGTVLVELLTSCRCSYFLLSNESIYFAVWIVLPELIICSNSHFAVNIHQPTLKFTTYIHASASLHLTLSTCYSFLAIFCFRTIVCFCNCQLCIYHSSANMWTHSFFVWFSASFDSILY